MDQSGSGSEEWEEGVEGHAHASPSGRGAGAGRQGRAVEGGGEPIMLDDDSSHDEIEDTDSEGGAWPTRPAQRKGSGGGQQQHGMPDQATKRPKEADRPKGQITSFFSKLPLGECAIMRIGYWPLSV